VLAVDCSYALITNAADAEAVRQNCPTIYGNLTFNTTENINLEGVQIVNGNISNIEDGCDLSFNCPATTPNFTISMPTLTAVYGNLRLIGYHGLTNLSLPNLAQTGQFLIWDMYQLVTLDITKLNTVSSFIIQVAPLLETMHHEGLTNFTGNTSDEYVTIYMVDTLLDSVDSIFANPFNLSGSALSVGFEEMSNLKTVTFGIASADKIFLGGGNATITLGGSKSTTMNLGNVTLSRGFSHFERHPLTQSISVGNLILEGTGAVIKDLLLPFEQLGRLQVNDYHNIERIRNLPQATAWKNTVFDFNVGDAFNMSSQFELDESGQMVQTWYWPQNDIGGLSMIGGYFTDDTL
jgi:hypothetical protein